MITRLQGVQITQLRGPWYGMITTWGSAAPTAGRASVPMLGEVQLRIARGTLLKVFEKVNKRKVLYEAIGNTPYKSKRASCEAERAAGKQTRALDRVGDLVYRCATPLRHDVLTSATPIHLFEHSLQPCIGSKRARLCFWY